MTQLSVIKKVNIIVLLLSISIITNAQVAVNTTGESANASAMLDVSSTNKGMLVPRMSTAQRTAIANPADALLVFDTSTDSFWYYNSTAAEWQQVGNAVAGASELNELSDAIHYGTCLFIGEGAGAANNTQTFANLGVGRFTLASNTSGDYNTANGHSSLWHNTTGNQNTANGHSSLSHNTTGSNNTGCGFQSLYYNETGNNNTAIGLLAARESIEGDNNVSIGKHSNYNNQNGNNNTIIGTDAGKGIPNHSKSGSVFLGFQAGYNETGSNKLYIENSNSSSPLIGGDFANDSLFFNGVVRITGGNPGANKILTSDVDGNATWEVNAAASELNELSDAKYDGSSVFVGEGAGAADDGTANSNTAFGKNALTSNTTGNYNTAMGSKVMQNNTASDNTAIGYETMNSNTSGQKNVAVGVIALKLNVTGDYNVAMGYAALKSAQSGDYNSAFGTNSLIATTTGDRNTGGGYRSLDDNTSGSNNTAFGYQSGLNNTTGTYNTFLGYNSQVNNSTAKSNSTALGNGTIITASNQVRIGNTSITSIGGYEPWTDLSDKRFKTNISEDITGLSFIMALRPVSYNLDIQKLNDFLGVDKENVDMKAVAKKSSIRQTGFIAQEVEQAAKSLGFDFSGVDIPENDNDHYGLRYAQFVVPLVKATQEQQQLIIKLQQEIKELKNSIKKLEK